MLLNGTKLGFKKKTESEYTDIPELVEVPDLGSEPNKVENTRIAAAVKNYEKGVGDVSDLKYQLDYDNSSTTASYRVLRKAAADNEELDFQETLPDGTIYKFSGTVSVMLKGGKIDDPGRVELTVYFQGEDFDVTDPV